MASAARVHLIEKGRDPRRYAMVAFGGAGPAHAVRVARVLGIGQVLIPPASGAASALGFLAAPLAFEQSRSVLTSLGKGTNWAQANANLAELEPIIGLPVMPICAQTGAGVAELTWRLRGLLEKLK